jgi:L-ornithine Nalpha-acyltransferase
MPKNDTRKNKTHKGFYMIEFLQNTKWKNTKYSVGIADTEKEVDEVHKLRFDIFNTELDEGIKENEKIKRDVDKYDKYCKHLIVKEKDTNKIIATYRMLPSWEMNKDLGFYTSSEFDISSLKLEEGINLETGRACIRKEHRGTNLIIIMLWLGMKEYCKENNVENIFGVTSIPKCSLKEISSLYNVLKQKNLIDLNEKVKSLIKVDIIPNYTKDYKKELFPSLLKAYTKMGAKIVGKPYYDPIFGCYDFFTILNMKTANWTFVESMFKLID